ncbi:lysis system i-spanin subunit Rz [Cronobacter sakazakii]
MRLFLRLTDSTGRDYFALTEEIAIVTKQVGHLQDFIDTHCLR